MDRFGPRVQAYREKEAAFASPCPRPVIALPDALSHCQGLPILFVRPHPSPFLARVPCRAEPDTAPSPILMGVGRSSQREAGENWQALSNCRDLYRVIEKVV